MISSIDNEENEVNEIYIYSIICCTMIEPTRIHTDHIHGNALWMIWVSWGSMLRGVSRIKGGTPSPRTISGWGCWKWLTSHWLVVAWKQPINRQHMHILYPCNHTKHLDLSAVSIHCYIPAMLMTAEPEVWLRQIFSPLQNDDTLRVEQPPITFKALLYSHHMISTPIS